MPEIKPRFAFRRPLFALLLLCLATIALAQPSPRSVVAGVYVPTVGKVLFFGGLESAWPEVVPSDRLLWWDPVDGTWSEGKSGRAPGGSLVFHEPSGLVVLYGGPASTTLGQTWFFDPMAESWENVTGDWLSVPNAGIAPGFAYHQASDTAVLFGGFNGQTGQYFSDTWHFDFAARSWAKAPTTGTPEGRNFFGMTYDPNSQRIYALGGSEHPNTLHAYDPVTRVWEDVAPGPGDGVDDFNQLVFDHDSGKLVQFGGVNASGGAAGTGSLSAWAFDTATLTWEEVVPTGPAPVQRWAHTMVSVPGLGIVMFGGNLSSTWPEGPATNEVWVLNVAEGRWEQR